MDDRRGCRRAAAFNAHGLPAHASGFTPDGANRRPDAHRERRVGGVRRSASDAGIVSMNGESACQGAPATREPEATIAGDPDGDLIVDVLADLRRYTDDPKASAVARRLKRR